MKRIFTVFVTIFLSYLCLASYGEVVSQEVAKQTAERILSQDEEWIGAGEATIRLVEHKGTPAYYVIEYSEGGWAVVSAQSSSHPLIAYNHTGAYVVPEPMQEVLVQYAGNIVETAATTTQEHVAWRVQQQRKPAADAATTPDIAPLIAIDLNQGEPFNKYCPKIDGQNALVGCVAVGMAQAMMVARFPVKATGKYSYSSSVGLLSINYDQEPEYDWDAMYASQQTGNYDEIARLVYHCGVSVNMEYGLDGSGAQTPKVAEALVRNFGYDKELVRYVDKPESDNAWVDFLLDELVLGRVVVYRGQGEEGGHCWNIDGWKNSTQMVHVNWGWGGYGNGYFKINDMSDSYQNMSFPYLNGAVVGVGAPTTAPYGIKLSTTKFPLGTAAGVALADVTIMCEDDEAVFSYELKGPKHPVTQKYTASPYDVVDGKLVSTQTVEDKNSFKSVLIKVTNTGTGESFEKQFSINIVTTDAVESVMSDAMRIYPAVATDVVTIEVPAVGGNYAIYSVAGAQLQAGNLDAYKNEVNVSSLAAGTYILQYVHQEGVGVKTFIKK